MCYPHLVFLPIQLELHPAVLRDHDGVANLNKADTFYLYVISSFCINARSLLGNGARLKPLFFDG